MPSPMLNHRIAATLRSVVSFFLTSRIKKIYTGRMSHETTPPHPIDRAAAIVGSQAKLAGCLGVTRAAVNQWKAGDRQVPADHCPAIERATGGVVRCEDLRPDVDWGVLRDAKPSTLEA